jgi:hypothetical protein
MTRTYVDAVGAARAWINSRTDTLVGPGMPLQKGAHLKELEGAADACYAYLTMLPGTTTTAGAENPSMAARLSASIYGPTVEAITNASLALADELLTDLAGAWTTVTFGNPARSVQIWVGDDITGPSDLPDGNLPRQIVDFTLIMQPAPI